VSYYRFKRSLPGHMKGDRVPAGWTPGMINTGLSAGTIELVPSPPDTNTFSPDNKAVKAQTVKRKAP
jgi:hypothetical protein